MPNIPILPTRAVSRKQLPQQFCTFRLIELWITCRRCCWEAFYCLVTLFCTFMAESRPHVWVLHWYFLQDVLMLTMAGDLAVKGGRCNWLHESTHVFGDKPRQRLLLLLASLSKFWACLAGPRRQGTKLTRPARTCFARHCARARRARIGINTSWKKSLLSGTISLLAQKLLHSHRRQQSVLPIVLKAPSFTGCSPKDKVDDSRLGQWNSGRLVVPNSAYRLLGTRRSFATRERTVHLSCQNVGRSREARLGTGAALQPSVLKNHSS